MGEPPYVRFAVRASHASGRVTAADVVASVAAQIRDGLLPPGSRLPPVRALEATAGLSKNTAQAAYQELVSRGLLEAREREGYFVAAPSNATSGPSSRALPSPPLPALREVRGLPSRHIPRDVVSLSTVFIDPELLPRERLADCLRSVLRAPGLGSFYDAQGHPPLRELIASRLRARGFDCDASHVVITTGSQQAIDLMARAVSARRVAVESPVYAHARVLFEHLGHEVIGLPLDPFAGIALDAWERALAAHRPSFLYAITSYQNPTGYSYTSHELAAVLEMAARHDVALVEDDWGSDMLSGSEYRPMLRLLGGASVVYINSFTKKLLPSLRVGFLVAHPSLVPTLVAIKRLSTLGGAWLTEAVLAEFLDRGYYDTHLAALQRETDARYAQCLATLDAVMPEGVRWTTPGGGPTLWVEVSRRVDLAKVRAELISHGVAIETTDECFVGEPHLHGFRVSYAWLAPEVLRDALEKVGAVLRRTL